MLHYQVLNADRERLLTRVAALEIEESRLHVTSAISLRAPAMRYAVLTSRVPYDRRSTAGARTREGLGGERARESFRLWERAKQLGWPCMWLRMTSELRACARLPSR